MLFGTMLNLLSICESLNMKSNKQEALKHNELFPIKNVIDILPGEFCT